MLRSFCVSDRQARLTVSKSQEQSLTCPEVTAVRHSWQYSAFGMRNESKSGHLKAGRGKAPLLNGSTKDAAGWTAAKDREKAAKARNRPRLQPRR
jgi:hypothetical protein